MKKKKNCPGKDCSCMKDNPILMKVNPQPSEEDIDRLWREATKIVPGISRKEFSLAVNNFFSQHHHLPDPKKFKKIFVPGLDEKNKVVVLVGKTPKIEYHPHSKSRKAPHGYKHDCKNEYLLSTADGEGLFYWGKTFLRKDGWLVEKK